MIRKICIVFGTEAGQKKRYDKYINDTVAELKMDLGLLGAFCKDCKNFEKKEEDSMYGRCPYEKYCAVHEYDDPCHHWEERRET